MTSDLHGAMRLDDDLPAVRFERTYDTDPHDLWEAITDPARLERWFATVVGDLRQGGSFTIQFDDGADPDQRTDGTVIRCEPPVHLEFTWSFQGEPDSVVQVDLHGGDGGTALVLDHRRLPAASAAGYAAGWHCYVEALDAHLVGRPARGPEWDERWNELIPHYSELLASTT